MVRVITMTTKATVVEASWNVMAHVQNPDFVFRRNGQVHLNRWGGQFSRLLAAEVCASAVVMLDTPCSEVVWRVLATHSILQFPLHLSSRASPCAITFQLESNITNQSSHKCIWIKALPSLYLPWRYIGGGKLQLHLFLSSALDGGVWSVWCPGYFTPQEKASSRVGPKSQSGCLGVPKNVLVLPGSELHHPVTTLTALV